MNYDIWSRLITVGFNYQHRKYLELVGFIN